MPILLVILVPLALVFIYAVVSDLRRRRRRGAPRSHDISSAARTARADAEARAGREGGGLGGGLGGGVPGGGVGPGF